MAFDLSSAKFIGPALPEPFVKFDLEKILLRNNLLPETTGEEGKKLQNFWSFYRKKLRELGPNSGAIRVKNHVVDPLIEILGYSLSESDGKINTREGDEDGGFILKIDNGNSKLRVWTLQSDSDLEAPIKRGYAYRFSPIRIAQRVLLTKQERLGIITDGQELRLLISDSARPDSQVIISISTDWKNSREVPDTFRLLLAIASPKGLEILPDIIDKARLKQSTVTKELRIQARQAVEAFIQEVIDEPSNKEALDSHQDKSQLAKILWREGLIIVYRLLFILKGEASDDPARSFNFTGSSIWRNTYSPTVTLAHFVRKSIDDGADTGNLLEKGLKTIFKMFEKGVNSTELNISPLGGALFGENSTPLLSQLKFPERGCAKLLDKLFWTLSGTRSRSTARERIHYGALDIEDLGRVYEALLELEPGIASEKMCRLKRSKLEVVVPYAQGEKYKQNSSPMSLRANSEAISHEPEIEDENDEEDTSKKTKIEWIEEINPKQFYLRVGLGRKSTGSYYTPHSFVRFLVQETLGPKIEEVSPRDNPFPNKILQIKVLDPAMGSGHFLVEACRFMAEKLYEACRLCDEKAFDYERIMENEQDLEKKKELKKLADEWWNRVKEIPDPQDEILQYLPSSAPEGIESGFSQSKALALCKRLVAVHCLYGVDKNPLAVELAKLSLWLESQSEGYPLTFLDHRLIVGDSITGPFFEHLLKTPGSQKPLDDLFNQNLREKLVQSLKRALDEVKELEKSVGIDLTDIINKQKSKERLENLLLSFKILASAWAGGVMLGTKECDDNAYLEFAKHISETGQLPIPTPCHPDSTPCHSERSEESHLSPELLKAICKGLNIEEENLNLQGILLRIKDNKTIPALPYDLTFPEVFFELTEDVTPAKAEIHKKGFDVVLGNPPWDKILPFAKEFFASYDFSIIAASKNLERSNVEKKLLSQISIKEHFDDYIDGFKNIERCVDILYNYQIVKIKDFSTIGKQDLYRTFIERVYYLLKKNGKVGFVIPSAFHANEGATGVRKLYLEKMALKCCYSFENKKKLFEIHSSFKFALIVAEKNPEGTKEFSCAFYLHNEEWLFENEKNNVLTYDIDFIKISGGEYLSFAELRSEKDFNIIKYYFQSNQTFSFLCKKFNIKIGRQLNTTEDAHRFYNTNLVFNSGIDPRKGEISDELIKKRYFILHEGKTFWQYNDLWGNVPRFLVSFEKVSYRKDWIEAAKYFRLAFRLIAGATNERTSVFHLLPPCVITTNSAPLDNTPQKHPYINSLYMLAITNSFPFDYCIRQMVGASINLFILDRAPFPGIITLEAILIHDSLRLSCNHSWYKCLWQDQLGDNWREPNKKPFTFPVLETEQERWEVRSAIDAVVADAYGLNREQYEHILHSFDRASGPNPYTGICLQKFDELKQIGLNAFTKKYDPYWDIPLNENLPKPVIDIPIPEEKSGQNNLFGKNTN